MRSLVQSLVAIAAFSTGVAVRAQEWPRVHIGVAAGDPDWSVDMSEAGVPLLDPIYRPDKPVEPDSGWKLVVGFRPVRVVGMELQYVDFGEGATTVHSGWIFGSQVRTYQQTSSINVNADASVLTALLFIPMPKPSLDVYGKVGVADINDSLAITTTTIEVDLPNAPRVPIPPECIPYARCSSIASRDVERSESAPYIGIGTRVKIANHWALRVEYEAIDRDVEDTTTMLSIGLAWEH
jgi:hypothetical protein